MADTTSGVQVFVGPANQLEMGTVTTGPAAATLETVSDRLQRLNLSIPSPTQELVDAQTASAAAASAAAAASGTSAAAAGTSATAATAAKTDATAAKTAAQAAAQQAADAAAALAGGGVGFDPLDPDVIIISTRADGTIAVDPSDPDILTITA